MRKFLTCALCFVPTLAGAITLYYDKSGECDGWWLGTTQTGCPASNLRVTKFHPTTAESKVFGGIVIGGETVVESDGTLKSFNSLSENTKSAIRNATSLDVYKQEWNVDDTVTVNFDARGGKMSGATSRQMARGATLPTITGLRGDGASFGGWVDNSGNKVVSVPTNATGTQSLTATYTCGAGTSKNANDVCLPNGPIYDENGGQIPRDSIRYDDIARYTIRVKLHDRPCGNNNFSVTDGNEGMILECNRVWCFLPNGEEHINGLTYIGLGDDDNLNPIAGEKDLVAKISLPKNDDYIFRGYYYRACNNQSDLITDKTEKFGRAVGNFFPKSNTDWSYINVGNNSYEWQRTKYMSIYNAAIAWYGDQDIPGFHDQGLTQIDLYGAWARKCNGHGAHSTDSETCELQKGTRLGTDSNGLEAGDVFYKTSCPNGYHVQNNNGTYNPTCGLDEGDINMSYAFTNQYGDVVSCPSSITDSCNPADGNVSLLNDSDFSTNCGTRYALRWLKVNGTWYSPNKSVSCTSNILGTGNPVNVTGYVCDVCQETEHGTCVDIPRDRDTVINFDPHGAGTYTGNLWGGNDGTVNPTPKCQVMRCGTDGSVYTYLWKNPMTGIRSCEEPCPDGYAAYPNERTGDMQCLSPYEQCIMSCIEKPAGSCPPDKETYCQNETFSCPSPSLSLPDGMTIGSGVLGQNSTCTYTLGCSGSGAVLIKNGIGLGTSPQTIDCSGDACSVTANLQNQLAGYSCFTCPVSAAVGAPATLTISSAPYITPDTHTGVLTCNYKVWCKTGSYDDPVGTATCTSDSNQDTRCYVPMGTSYVYTNLASSINALEDNCTGATQTFACPTGFTVPGITITPDSGNATATSSCSYTLSCPNPTDILVLDTEREPDETGGPATVQCTGMSGNNSCSATSLSDKFSHYSCQSSEE